MPISAAYSTLIISIIERPKPQEALSSAPEASSPEYARQEN
jgi:hypothetical protein